jgi:hypothetical protein
MKVPYYIVIEQSDYEAYSAVIDPAKILILHAGMGRGKTTAIRRLLNSGQSQEKRQYDEEKRQYDEIRNTTRYPIELSYETFKLSSERTL